MDAQSKVRKAREALYKRVNEKTAQQAKEDPLFRLALACELWRPKGKRGRR